jgi:hypothetical protein
VPRPIIYGKWRTDKAADPGYSPELVNVNLPEKCYDDMEKLEFDLNECDTILKHFKR